MVKLTASSTAVAEDTAPVQRPVVSMAEIKKIASKVELHSVHPEVMGLLTRSDGDMEHVYATRVRNSRLTNGQKPQTEFIIARFPENASERDIREVAEVIHRLRGKKEPVTAAKVRGVSEKGYMLICEPFVVEVLNKMVPRSIIHPGSNGCQIG